MDKQFKQILPRSYLVTNLKTSRLFYDLPIKLFFQRHMTCCIFVFEQTPVAECLLPPLCFLRKDIQHHQTVVFLIAALWHFLLLDTNHRKSSIGIENKMFAAGRIYCHTRDGDGGVILFFVYITFIYFIYIYIYRSYHASPCSRFVFDPTWDEYMFIDPI